MNPRPKTRPHKEEESYALDVSCQITSQRPVKRKLFVPSVAEDITHFYMAATGNDPTLRSSPNDFLDSEIPEPAATTSLDEPTIPQLDGTDDMIFNANQVDTPSTSLRFAAVKLHHPNDESRSVVCNPVLDDGAFFNCLNSEVANSLCLDGPKTSISVKGFGDTKSQFNSTTTNVVLTSLDERNPYAADRNVKTFPKPVVNCNPLLMLTMVHSQKQHRLAVDVDDSLDETINAAKQLRTIYTPINMDIRKFASNLDVKPQPSPPFVFMRRFNTWNPLLKFMAYWNRWKFLAFKATSHTKTVRRVTNAVTYPTTQYFAAAE